jgi:hypothetical protein
MAETKEYQRNPNLRTGDAKRKTPSDVVVQKAPIDKVKYGPRRGSVSE